MGAEVAVIALLLAGCHGWLAVDPPGQVFRVMSFEDRSDALGAEIVGSTFGMGWGDVDGDGWPDLWVGNHASAPTLYLNQRDGTFRPAQDAWLPADLNRTYDAHGVAWADLDRDGDADLVESVGAQQGEGEGRNRVYMNGAGQLIDHGLDDGLGYPEASGRCPIPTDWNRDGRVDFVMVSQPKLDGSYPTALFTQREDGGFSFSAEVPAELAHPTALCGQLADVDGDDVAEVVAFGRPGHLSAYDGLSGELADVSAEVGLPTPPLYPYDVVLADLDNDLDDDLYMTRWDEVSAVKVDAEAGYLGMALRVEADAQGARFRSDGQLRISLDPPGFWSPGDLRLGGDCSHVAVAPDAMEVTVTEADADVQGLCAIQPGVDTGLFIGVQDGVWEVRLASAVWNRGNVVVRADAPLTDVEMMDVRTLSVDEERQFNRDRLFIRKNGAYVDEGWARGIQELTTCTSVAAGDFDNDMDLDLFLVCASPVENTPDMLYLNEGGRFTRVEGFGAEGTSLGRGDSVAVADYDQDGLLDLFVSNGYAARPFNLGPHQLFHNTCPLGHHWVEIDLVGTVSTVEALGAKVIVRAGGVEQAREQTAGTHHMAQHFRRLHFGLGANERIDEIEVRWPGGAVSVIEGEDADQLLTLVEPEGDRG